MAGAVSLIRLFFMLTFEILMISLVSLMLGRDEVYKFSLRTEVLRIHVSFSFFFLSLLCSVSCSFLFSAYRISPHEPQDTLRTIWSLSDTVAPRGQLSENEFMVACKLVAIAQAGGEVVQGAEKAAAKLPVFDGISLPS